MDKGKIELAYHQKVHQDWITGEDSEEYTKRNDVNILNYIDNWKEFAKKLKVPKGSNLKPVNELQEKYHQDIYDHDICFEYETINGVKHFDIDIRDSDCQVSIGSISMGDYLDKTVNLKMKELGYKRIEKNNESYWAYKIKESDRTIFVYYWKDDNGCIKNINIKTDYEKA